MEYIPPRQHSCDDNRILRHGDAEARRQYSLHISHNSFSVIGTRQSTKPRRQERAGQDLIDLFDHTVIVAADKQRLFRFRPLQRLVDFREGSAVRGERCEEDVVFIGRPHARQLPVTMDPRLGSFGSLSSFLAALCAYTVGAAAALALCSALAPRHLRALAGGGALDSVVARRAGVSVGRRACVRGVARTAAGGFDLHPLLLQWQVCSSSYDMYPPPHMTCIHCSCRGGSL